MILFWFFNKINFKNDIFFFCFLKKINTILGAFIFRNINI